MIVTSIERTKKTPEGRKHGKSSWERGERGRKEGRRRTVSPLEKSQREISRPDYKVVFVKSKKRFTTAAKGVAPVLSLRAAVILSRTAKSPQTGSE